MITSGKFPVTVLCESFFLNCIVHLTSDHHRPAVASTAAQPKSIAITNDTTVFVVEIGTVEAFRSNQKVYDNKPKYAPSVVAAWKTTVAVGAEVLWF